MLLNIQWPLVLFGLLCGLGGTLLAATCVAQLMGKAKEARFVSLVVSMVIMVVGGCTVLLHLALPLNAFYAVTNLFSFSGISVEVIALAIAFVIALVFAILIKREQEGTVLKVLAVLGIIAGIVLAYVCGHGYVLESREYWNTEFMPLAYAATLLPAGIFLFLALASKLGCSFEDLKAFKVVAIVCVVLSVLISFGYLASMGFDVASRNPLVSYGMLVVCGMVGEIACLCLYMNAKNEKSLFIAVTVGFVLAFLAALGVRLEMWLTSDPYFNAFYWEVENGTPIGTDDY